MSVVEMIKYEKCGLKKNFCPTLENVFVIFCHQQNHVKTILVKHFPIFPI